MDLSMIAADKKLKNLLQQLSLGPAVKPLNLFEEREAFLHPRLSLRRKSPVFKYENSPLKWAGFKPFIPLESIDAPEDVIDIYNEKLQELETTRRMFSSVGSDRFTDHSIEIFGAPSSDDANQARKVLEKLSDVAPPERNCSAKEFANLLEARLVKLGISMNIKIVPSMATKISVDSVSRTIHLDQNTLFAPQEVRRLLVHEIDVHAVRIHNGSCLPWGVFSLGTSGYREAEEGLAVHHEHQSGHLYPFQEKIYAGRCLAVYLSLSAGFADVFEELLLYFDEKTAYSIVERIKRGLTDTSQPGALTKEFHYFTGPNRVRSYLQNGGNLQNLMGGKIAFKHAKVMARLVLNNHVETSKWIIPLEINDD
ncbi:tyrosine/phenylalanine carboxypeptidase domain-containing protein [Thermodesulfobacteriota bacterium]